MVFLLLNKFQCRSLFNNFYVPYISPPVPDLTMSLVDPYTNHLERLTTFHLHFQDLRPNVEYLGHVTHNKKKQAIQDVPKLKNVAKIRTFLGILNYYS